MASGIQQPPLSPNRSRSNREAKRRRHASYSESSKNPLPLAALDAVIITCPPDDQSLMRFDQAAMANRVELLVPRNVLSASPAIGACFGHAVLEAEQHRVDIADIPASIMKIVIAYMHFATICPPLFNSGEQLKNKSRLEMSDEMIAAKVMRERFVQQHITASTVYIGSFF